MTRRMRKATTRDLVGRTIAAVRWGTVTSSVPKLERVVSAIVLDNGRELYFHTLETEGGGEYGTEIGTLTKGGTRG